jgi:hypothetical protein
MLVLVMVFKISVALTLGFTSGRIYQIWFDDKRRAEASPVARVPGP